MNFSYFFRWYLSTPAIVSSAVCDSLSTKFFAPCLLHLLLQLGCAILLRLFFPFFPFFSQSTVHIHQKRKWGKKGPEKGRKIPWKLCLKRGKKELKSLKINFFVVAVYKNWSQSKYSRTSRYMALSYNDLVDMWFLIGFKLFFHYILIIYTTLLFSPFFLEIRLLKTWIFFKVAT